MFSRPASHHGEHGNIAPLRSSSSAVDVRPGASEEYVGIVKVEICPAIVVWVGGATCIGDICWEDVGSSKDKECGIPIFMDDAESSSAPSRIGNVLHTNNPLPKLGAQLAAVKVCSMALGTVPGLVLTCN